MENQDYHKSITTDVSAEEVFKKICSVNKWWTANFKGSAKNLNDIFTLQFGENKFTFKVVEFVPNKKLVWLVADCYMPWLNDKTEWKNTKIVFEILEEKNQTRIDMTHVGLVSGIECYNVCEVGWNQYFGESIPELLATGKGILFDD
jgi:Activator of Hsp90 ATPase homolog 1-like protein